MPYILPHERTKYDPHIDSLAAILNKQASNDVISGDMNYVLFRLAKLLCDSESGGECKYARMAVVRSALREAHDEFKRRFMDDYEDEKIVVNGDV